MRILFAGTPEVALPTLERLIGSEHEVVGVITREDAPLGRKRVLTPSPVGARATELGLPVMKANRLTEEVTNWAADLNADVGVVVAYGGLLRRELLDTPRHGWVNLHFSSLPLWRGAAPVQRALMNGEQRLGLSVFRLVEALDAGDLLTSDTTTVEPGTSAGEALGLLAEQGTGLVLDALTMLRDDAAAGQPQTGEPTYAHKLERTDGKLAVSKTAAEVLARWAGVTPEPGAYVKCEGEALKMLELRQAETEPSLAPGEAAIVGKRALLGTGQGTLELVRVQPAGKGAMDGAAWLRGRGGSQVVS